MEELTSHRVQREMTKVANVAFTKFRYVELYLKSEVLWNTAVIGHYRWQEKVASNIDSHWPTSRYLDGRNIFINSCSQCVVINFYVSMIYTPESFSICVMCNPVMQFVSYSILSM